MQRLAGHNVRPAGYYLGALVERADATADPPQDSPPGPESEPDTFPCPKDPERAAIACAEVFEGDAAFDFLAQFQESSGASFSDTLLIDDPDELAPVAGLPEPHPGVDRSGLQSRVSPQVETK